MTSDTSLLAMKLGSLASSRALRIAAAESLTGGLLSSAIVSAAGASHYFVGAIVAYDTAVKHSLLGVDPQLLRTNGPVDDEVARQMARGVREACGATLATDVKNRQVDIGVATTGVAGPDPDPQTGQPVGTIWIGVSSDRGERAVHLQLSGTRLQIREATVHAALQELIAEIESL